MTSARSDDARSRHVGLVADDRPAPTPADANTIAPVQIVAPSPITSGARSTRQRAGALAEHRASCTVTRPPRTTPSCTTTCAPNVTP
jgi:hypothetical protein